MRPDLFVQCRPWANQCRCRNNVRTRRLVLALTFRDRVPNRKNVVEADAVVVGLVQDAEWHPRAQRRALPLTVFAVGGRA
jgi:hypothetical protein